MKTLTKLACRTSPDMRIPDLIDSRVTIGAGAKGRSSSSTLNRIQQGSLGYVLGRVVYRGLLYAPTGIHRADDHTRHRAIRSPRIDTLAWLSDLESERFSRLDIVLLADRLCRPWNLWCRLLRTPCGRRLERGQRRRGSRSAPRCYGAPLRCSSAASAPRGSCCDPASATGHDLEGSA